MWWQGAGRQNGNDRRNFGRTEGEELVVDGTARRTTGFTLQNHAARERPRGSLVGRRQGTEQAHGSVERALHGTQQDPERNNARRRAACFLLACRSHTKSEDTYSSLLPRALGAYPQFPRTSLESDHRSAERASPQKHGSKRTSHRRVARKDRGVRRVPVRAVPSVDQRTGRAHTPKLGTSIEMWASGSG